MEKKNTTKNIFHYHNLVIKTHPEVYDPAEDSFLLLDTLDIDAKEKILELGTGCGIIALNCARQGSYVICTDINPYAIQLTRLNIERNKHILKGFIEIRQGNLFSALHKKELFNVIIFNPPYLPTKKQQKVGGWFDIAINGGQNGLTVTKKFIEGLRKHLCNTGRAYFIFSSLSNKSTLERYLKNERLYSSIIARRKFEGEELDVYCVTPAD